LAVLAWLGFESDVSKPGCILAALSAGLLFVALDQSTLYSGSLDNLFLPSFHSGALLSGLALTALLLNALRRGFSRSGLRVNQLSHDLSIFHWINNPAWYNHKPGNQEGRPVYSFILTNELTKEFIEENFGAPASVEYCGKIEVYVYDRDGDSAFRDYQPCPL